MKKNLVMICMLMIVCMSVFAEKGDRWVECYKDSDRYVVFDVQTFTITKEDSILVWEKTTYAKPLFKVNKKDVCSDLARTEYRKNGTFGLKSSTYYDKNGKVIFTHSYKDDEIMWTDIHPGSIVEAKLELYLKIVENIPKK